MPTTASTRRWRAVELTAEQVEKVTASMYQDWRKDPVPFPSYLLTNNNANIRRVRQRIEELSHKAEFVGWTFPGGEAKVNEAENRLQLILRISRTPIPGRRSKARGGSNGRPAKGHGSGSMNGGITAATVPLWNRTLRRGCRSTSAFTMSVSSRPRPPAFTSITPPSAPWTLGHSRSRPATPQMRSSTTISASRLKMDRFWRGGI